MTTEEKRQAIHDFCCGRDCTTCPHNDGYCNSYRLDGTTPPEIIDLWYQSIFGAITIPTIKDSGARTEFASGAVRDIQVGKGRCDLMPLDVIAECHMRIHPGDDTGMVFNALYMFTQTGDIAWLINALSVTDVFNTWSTMFLEVAKHFEEGAKKYGENNWQKGIPVRCYIDSAIRHYLKWIRGDNDEPHDRAFVWNIMCAIWTCKHKPELNEYAQQKCPVCGENMLKDETTCSKCKMSVKGGEQ